MDWISFTLLYEKDEDLILFQDLLIEHNNLKDEENFSPINLRKLPVDEDYGYCCTKLPILSFFHGRFRELDSL